MKAAIIGLVRGYPSINSYRRLIHRNRLLHRNFNKKYNYPIIIFHEGNILQGQQNILCKFTPNLKFIDVSNYAFIIPKGLPIDWRDQIGYKHMCRFYALQIFDLLDDYEFIWRLDDDSYLESKINYDIFDYMKDNDLDYGYIYKEDDYHPETVATLPTFTKDYIKKHNVKINCTIQEIDALYYYSNFTITKVSFWKENEVQDFLIAIDNSLGIYQYRWGDHVIQTHALKMFSKPANIHYFNDFDYSHGSHRWSNYTESKIHSQLRQIQKNMQWRIDRLYIEYLMKNRK